MDNIVTDFGINLMENEIDEVIFKTNEFLSEPSFIGSSGAFWYILQISMALAALFALIMAAGMAYRMMVKNEPLDVLRLFKPLAIALVLCWWYPPGQTGTMSSFGGDWCVLDFLAFIPNCIGSYTHDLYEAEATQIEDQFDKLQEYMIQRDTLLNEVYAKTATAENSANSPESTEALIETTGVDEVVSAEEEAKKLGFITTIGGVTIFIDKLVTVVALIIFRIGWWATIYVQQILLGMLTIFGPIQWAFSLLPKWESAWSRWITRYLTVQFYGAMLYFVGFYVLLLFDIVLSIQVENLQAIVTSESTFAEYCQNAFLSAGYLLCASIVSLKCLNLVPDLAAWMIPEGDTAFSTRNFGEGVASQTQMMARGAMNTGYRMLSN